MAPSCVLRSVALAATVLGASAEFKAIEFLPGLTDCNVTLTTSVPVHCKAKTAKDQKYDVWKTNLDFLFGKVSKEQWETLRHQYTAPWAGSSILSGSTRLFSPYDDKHEYSLKDFLPVTVRALADYNFVEEDESLPAGVPLPPAPPAAPKLYEKSVMVPNCWATVYETLRTIVQGRADDSDVFHDVFSTDDKDAQLWLESATTEVPGLYTAAERKFGDVMFVFLHDAGMKRTLLEHAFIFMDNDVVFEKAGTGAKNPYRLIDIATVEKEWKPTLQGGLFEWKLHRPLLGAGQRKSFAEQFSLLAMTPDVRWPQFWQWPHELQATYTLGTADNPRDPTAPVDELTLLKARRYSFLKNGNKWIPYQRGLAQEALIV